MSVTTFPYYGTVSHGTMRAEDLIPAFLSVLEDLAPDRYRSMISGDDPQDAAVIACLTVDGRGEITDDLLEHASEMLHWLFDELDTCAPDGYYFGSHPGDGSDYGFWQVEDDELAGLSLNDSVAIQVWAPFYGILVTASVQ